MCLFGVEQSCGLDTRRNGHQIVILFEDRNKSRTTRPEDFCGIHLLHPRFTCGLVTFGKLGELLIQRQEISLLIFECDAEARECARRVIAGIARCRYLLVKTCNQRNNALDIRIRKLEHPIECRRLTCRDVETLCELVDILPSKHRVFRNVE